MHEFCESKAPKGLSYQGYWGGLYHYVSGNAHVGFIVVTCTYEEIVDGTLELKAKNELARSRV